MRARRLARRRIPRMQALQEWLLDTTFGCRMPIVRVQYHQVIAMNYSQRAQTLLIHSGLGSILVTGPKAEAFFERFCEHKIGLVKADGKETLRVSLAHQHDKVQQACGSSTGDGEGQRGPIHRGPIHKTPASLKLKYPCWELQGRPMITWSSILSWRIAAPSASLRVSRASHSL
jgi:hypothetical protein